MSLQRVKLATDIGGTTYENVGFPPDIEVQFDEDAQTKFGLGWDLMLERALAEWNMSSGTSYGC